MPENSPNNVTATIANCHRIAEAKVKPLTEQLDRLDHIIADLQNHMDRVFSTLGIGKPSKPSKLHAMQELQMLQVNRHNENRDQLASLQATVNQLTEAVAELDQPKKPGHMEATTDSNLAGIDAVLTRLEQHERSIKAEHQRTDKLAESLHKHRSEEHRLLAADVHKIRLTLANHIDESQPSPEATTTQPA